MDSSFTEHVLERARKREKKLRCDNEEANFESQSQPNLVNVKGNLNKRKEIVSDPTPCPSMEKISKHHSRSKITSSSSGSILRESVNLQNINVEIAVQSSENIRLEVEIDTISDDAISNHSNENSETTKTGLRENAKNHLKKLGKLYSGNEDLSSPIQKTEERFAFEEAERIVNKKVISENVCKNKKGLLGLADLAYDINQWEEYTSKINDSVKVETPKKSWKPPAPKPPTIQNVINKQRTKYTAPKPPSAAKTVLRGEKSTDLSNESSETVSMMLDSAIINNLESQGFTRSASNSRLIFKCESPQAARKETKLVDTKLVESRKALFGTNTVANKASIFEKEFVRSPLKKENDPALLSVSERRALFEKNRDVVTSKSGFGKSISSPIKKITTSSQQIENRIKEERQKELDILKNRFKKPKFEIAVEKQEDINDFSDDDDDIEVDDTTAMINKTNVKVVPASVNTSSPRTPQLSSEARRSGEKRPKKGDSPQVQAVLGEVKRIKVAVPKDGNLYPCLSDIEGTTETETETVESTSHHSSLFEESFCTSDDETNTSFGREILEAVCNNQSSLKQIDHGDVDSESLDTLELEQSINELDCDSEYLGSIPASFKHPNQITPKENGTISSESFNYRQYSPNKSRSPVKKVTSPMKVSKDLPTHIINEGEIVPLIHTVSFYRKQHSQPSTTPIKKIIRSPQLEEETEEQNKTKLTVMERIAQLKQELNKQQMVISQTSRALNLCNSTAEFCGSSEQVEAEKVLLLATHRRLEATSEIQRLEVEGTLRPIGSHSHDFPLEKGSIIISDIVLPLKKEYVRALAAAGGKGHHIVCLIKSSGQVVSSQLASTVASPPKDPELDLKIPGKIRLDNIYSDFTVTFEVYCLRAQEELLPHDIKYHISKKNNAKSTPIKFKQGSRSTKPTKKSPTCSQAVCLPTFALNGYIVFSVQAVNKTAWTLNKIPQISPLEGSITMKIKCELDISTELRGFLDMFEDISGLGAWHRRWCLLKNNKISFWKYPEDEKIKAPIGCIELNTCVKKMAKPVSRDVCARPNTFSVERERSPLPEDKNSLTVTCTKDKTIIKYLLSADSKEERIKWCDNLSKCIVAIRTWGLKSTDITT